MQVSFDFQIKKLSGEDFPGDDSHAGKVLANALSQGNSREAIKFYDWALKLWNKQSIEVSKTDFELLKAWIETTEILPVITKAQLIKAIDDQNA